MRRKILIRKMRIPPGFGDQSDIRDGAHAMRPQDLDQLFE
jgi:hypothetical protein